MVKFNLNVILVLALMLIAGCCELGGPTVVHLTFYGSMNSIANFDESKITLYYFQGTEKGYSFSKRIWLEGDIVGIKVLPDGEVTGKWKIHYDYPYLGREKCIFGGLIKIENSQDTFVRCIYEDDSSPDFAGKLLLLTSDGEVRNFYTGSMRYYSYAVSFEAGGRSFYFLTFYNKVADEWEYKHRLLPYMRKITGGVLSRSIILDDKGHTYGIRCEKDLCNRIYDASTWLPDGKILFQTIEDKLGVGELMFDGDQFYLMDVTFTDLGVENGFYSILFGDSINSDKLILYARKISFEADNTLANETSIFNFAEIRARKDLSLIKKYELSSGWWSEDYLGSQNEILDVIGSSEVSDEASYINSPAFTASYDGENKILFAAYARSLYAFSITSYSWITIDISTLLGDGKEISDGNSTIFGRFNYIWLINWLPEVDCKWLNEKCEGNIRRVYEVCRAHHTLYQIKNWQDKENKEMVKVKEF